MITNKNISDLKDRYFSLMSKFMSEALDIEQAWFKLVQSGIESIPFIINAMEVCNAEANR